MFKEIFEDERKIASSYRRQTMPKKKIIRKAKKSWLCTALTLETLDIKTDKEETDQKAPKVLFKMFEQTQNLIRNFESEDRKCKSDGNFQ